MKRSGRTVDAWSAVDVRHLLALHGVATLGSFRAAAAELGYTQSAISHQIATLEDAVGHQLVVRTPGARAVALTPAGELMLEHAGKIVAHVRTAQADLDALTDGRVRALSVGCYQSITARFGGLILERFADAMPDTKLSLVESATDEDLLERLRSGELDFTFAMMPLPEGPFEAEEVLVDPFVLVVPADSPLAARSVATAEDIRGLPLVRRKSANAYPVRDHLRERGIEPNFVFESDLNSTMVGFVAGGYGCAILPKLMVSPDDPRVRIVELEPEFQLLRRIVLVRDRHRHAPGYETVLGIARSVLRTD